MPRCASRRSIRTVALLADRLLEGASSASLSSLEELVALIRDAEDAPVAAAVATLRLRAAAAV